MTETERGRYDLDFVYVMTVAGAVRTDYWYKLVMTDLPELQEDG